MALCLMLGVPTGQRALIQLLCHYIQYILYIHEIKSYSNLKRLSPFPFIAEMAMWLMLGVAAGCSVAFILIALLVVCFIRCSTKTEPLLPKTASSEDDSPQVNCRQILGDLLMICLRGTIWFMWVSAKMWAGRRLGLWLGNGVLLSRRKDFCKKTFLLYDGCQKRSFEITCALSV